MRRVIVGLLLLACLLPMGVAAQGETYTIDVEVVFRSPLVDEPIEGDPCGYDLLTLMYEGPWPPAAQVVVTHAGGVVVGTIDLMGIGAEMASSEDYHSLKPGTFDDNGFCRVAQSIEVTPSPFYTFTVDGHYEWTVSTEMLKALDWHWQVVFLS